MPDERDSFVVGLLLRFLARLFDSSPPDYPDGEPWYVKHYLWISIPITLVPAAVGIFVFDDLLLGVGCAFAAMGLFSMIFGVAPTITSVIMSAMRSRSSGMVVRAAGRSIRSGMTHEQRYRIHHGARARLMGLLYVLTGLMFMPFIDGSAPFLVLYLAIKPEGQ